MSNVDLSVSVFMTIYLQPITSRAVSQSLFPLKFLQQSLLWAILF